MTNKGSDTKKLLIYILLAFSLTHTLDLLFTIGKCHYYNSDGTISGVTGLIAALSMLMPAIAMLLTRLLTKEGFKLTGDDSLLLGISFKNKKLRIFILALIVPYIAKELGSLIEIIIFNSYNSHSALLGEYGNDTSMLLPLLPFVSLNTGITASIGGLGEELGWRAYMMPKLEKKLGITKAVIAGGIIWGAWHYPLLYHGHAYGTDYPGFPWLGPIIFTITATCMNAFLTYLTKRSGSIWPATFAHAVNNNSTTILAVFVNSEKMPRWESTLGIATQIPIVITGITSLILLAKSSKSANESD